MRDEDKKTVAVKLSALLGRSGSQRGYILFGAGGEAARIVEVLHAGGVEPRLIIDNDPVKSGKMIAGVPVEFAPSVLRGHDREDVLIICSAFRDEMAALARRSGWPGRRIWDVTPDEWIHPVGALGGVYALAQGLKGLRSLKQLRGQSGGSRVHLFPYSGTGDVYLGCALLLGGCESEERHAGVAVVTTKACEQVARLFPQLEVARFSHGDVLRMVRAARSFDVEGVRIMNDGWGGGYSADAQWLRNAAGLDFRTMFERVIFGSPTRMSLRAPLRPASVDGAETLIRNGLIPKATVVLAPDATTLGSPEPQFWSDLADELSGRGFAVCENVSSPDSRGRSGARPLFLPLVECPGLVDAAGYFVGARSGFCEVICETRARKVVLYDADARFYRGTAFDYFGFQQMGMGMNIRDLQWRAGQGDRLVDDVLRELIES